MANNHTHFYISVTKEIKYTWKIFPWWKEKLALFVPKLNHRCFSYWVSVSYKISLLYFSTLSYLPLILFVGRENEVNFPTNTRRLRLRFQLVLFLFPVDAAWTISFQASTANFSKKKNIYMCFRCHHDLWFPWMSAFHVSNFSCPSPNLRSEN